MIDLIVGGWIACGLIGMGVRAWKEPEYVAADARRGLAQNGRSWNWPAALLGYFALGPLGVVFVTLRAIGNALANARLRHDEQKRFAAERAREVEREADRILAGEGIRLVG